MSSHRGSRSFAAGATNTCMIVAYRTASQRVTRAHVTDPSRQRSRGARFTICKAVDHADRKVQIPSIILSVKFFNRLDMALHLPCHKISDCAPDIIWINAQAGIRLVGGLGP